MALREIVWPLDQRTKISSYSLNAANLVYVLLIPEDTIVLTHFRYCLRVTILAITYVSVSIVHPAPIPKFSQKTSLPQFALSCAKF